MLTVLQYFSRKNVHHKSIQQRKLGRELKIKTKKTKRSLLEKNSVVLIVKLLPEGGWEIGSGVGGGSQWPTCPAL